jgi:hypothetical protein
MITNRRRAAQFAAVSAVLAVLATLLVLRFTATPPPPSV